ncbi:MAG TPA: FtsX-like permease family protein, partial [Puia sp.]|nr:FtsX-like permease family protein [Puia sp.]
NAHTALNEPNNIVLTRRAARSLFGETDAMGKMVRVDNWLDYTVTGVMEDLPNNTQFDFEYLLPWKFMQWTHQDDSDWASNSTRNYILLKPNTDVARVNEKIRDIYKRHAKEDKDLDKKEAFLYPVSRLHLYSNFEDGVPAGGRIEVRVFLLIAVFILLIACINFMNMSTARSERRAKEVGIRKVSGALRGSLVGQFLGESTLIALVAGAIALLLVQVSLPGFNLLTKKQLVIGYGSPAFWMGFAGFILFTGVVSGSYPAFFLSGFRPVAVLKGSFKKAHALITPRKVLVVLQFTFAIILIVSTLIIRQQVQYAQSRATGYDKDDVVWTYLSGDVGKNYDLIRNELLDRRIALSVTKSSEPLSASWSVATADWNGKDPNDGTQFNFFNEDGGIVKTAGLQLLEGRDLDTKHYPTDSTGVLLNQAAVKAMGLRHPIGQIIDRGVWDADWHVVGVVKDFVLESPFDRIKPMVIQGPRANWFNLMHIRLNGANPTARNLADLEKVFKRFNPNYPFEYHFTDQEYARKFNDEQATATLTALFAGLTILISCLGLFGLAAYMAEARIKEIGVRKVLGASAAGIVTLLSKDFIRLVLIALLVAAPIAWWSMDKWLSGFEYRIAIPWWIFLVSGAIAVLIAVATVSVQAIRAALVNPARSLRSE